MQPAGTGLPAPAPNVPNWPITTPTASPWPPARGKDEDSIDRQYFLRYDLANPQGDKAPPKSSAISANYSWTGRYFNNASNPTRGYGLAFELGLGSTLTPERTPFTRVLGRWQYFKPLGERDAATKRRARLMLRSQVGAVVARKGTDIPLTLLFLIGRRHHRARLQLPKHWHPAQWR